MAAGLKGGSGGVESLPELKKPLSTFLPESGSRDCQHDIRTERGTVDSFSQIPYFLNASCNDARADCACCSRAECCAASFSCVFVGGGLVSASIAKLPIKIWTSCASSSWPLDSSPIRDWTARRERVESS